MAARQFVQVNGPRYRCYVGNLPTKCIESHIEHIFEGCNITDVHMVRSQETDEFRGFAYVEFKDKESYNLALTFDGADVDGLRLRVNDADRRGPNNRGPSNMPGNRGRGNNYTPRSGRDYGHNDFEGSGYNRPNMNRNRGSFGNDRHRGNTGGYRPKVQESFNAPDSFPIVDDKDRPRLSLQPRSKPLVADRELSERSKAIFGIGKPRAPSPRNNTNEPPSETI